MRAFSKCATDSRCHEMCVRSIDITHTLFSWISASACGRLISLTFLRSFSFVWSFVDVFLITTTNGSLRSPHSTVFGDFRCFLNLWFYVVFFRQTQKKQNPKKTFFFVFTYIFLSGTGFTLMYRSSSNSRNQYQKITTSEQTTII